MAQKKCPKCGEDNPAEAVMCWACYTPLSGAPAVGAGAVAAAGGGLAAKGPIGSPLGAPSGSEGAGEKKKLDPKTIGVAAFMVVGILVAFLANGGMSGGGSGEEETPAAEDKPADPNPGGGAAPTGGVAPPPFTAAPGGGGQAPPAPIPLPFQTVVPPNPKYKTGTMGIKVTGNGALSPGQAAGFAKFARNQFARNGNWTDMQICVFSDDKTADAFKAYQGARRGAPLTNADYAQLAARGVWNNSPAFLEARGKKELVYTPSLNPSGWWIRR